MNIKTFKDFQATRKFGDIGHAVGTTIKVDGFTYLDNYVITNISRKNGYCLDIENRQYEDDDLERLEYILYAYCSDIGAFENYTTIDALSSIYGVFCEHEGVNIECAYEKAYRSNNTPTQQYYLDAYNVLWDYYTNNDLDTKVIK